MTAAPLAGATVRGAVEIPDSRGASLSGDPDGVTTAGGRDDETIDGTTAGMTAAPQPRRPRF